MDALEEFADKLIELEDEIYNQKWDYVLYIQALIKAFSEDRTNELVSKWADVDRAWMKIKTQFKSDIHLNTMKTTLEKLLHLNGILDLTNPKFAQNDHRVNKIKSAFSKIYSSFEPNAKSEE